MGIYFIALIIASNKIGFANSKTNHKLLILHGFEHYAIYKSAKTRLILDSIRGGMFYVGNVWLPDKSRETR